MTAWLNSYFGAWQAGLLAAGLTVPLLVAMYFLRLRRRVMVVSSTLLWKKAVHDLEVNAPFQRIRRNLLLLLQLLILLGLLLAFARPLTRAQATTGERAVIVIDQSASMNATDVAPSRLEAAKRAALSLADQYDGGSIMVVAFGHQARVLQSFTQDRSLVRAAINAVGPTDFASELGPALALIEPYVLEPSGGGGPTGGTRKIVVYVVSDGRVTDGQPLSLRGGELRFVPIGARDAQQTADNVAIVSLSARRDLTRPQRVQVFARLANYGAQAVAANLSLAVDGRVQKVMPVDVPAWTPGSPGMASAAGGAAAAPEGSGGAAGSGAKALGVGGSGGSGGPGTQVVTFDLVLAGNALVTVAHDHDDQLAADNSASIVLAPPQQVQVLLVTEGNAFLQSVLGLSSIGVKKLVVMTPKKYEDQDPRRLRRGAGGTDEGFDVIVFDGYSPKGLAAVDSLYLGAVPPIAGLERLPPGPGEPRAQVLLNWDRDHPILRYVALDDLVMVEPGHLTLPPTAAILATGQGGPAMADLLHEGVHHVMTSFHLLKTNWPVQTSFIPFVTNAVQSLALGGGEGAVSFRPGEVAVVPVDGRLKEVVYDGPARVGGPVERGRATLSMFERAGVYEARTPVAAPWDRLAVNITDATESDLHPAEQLQVAAASTRTISSAGVLRQEVWRCFAWAALAVLMLEWLVYTRRMHL